MTRLYAHREPHFISTRLRVSHRFWNLSGTFQIHECQNESNRSTPSNSKNGGPIRTAHWNWLTAQWPVYGSGWHHGTKRRHVVVAQRLGPRGAAAHRLRQGIEACRGPQEGRGSSAFEARGEDPSEARRASVARRNAAQVGVGTLGSVIAAYYEQGPGAVLRSGASRER
jgi:hypothetical protein